MLLQSPAGAYLPDIVNPASNGSADLISSVQQWHGFHQNRQAWQVSQWCLKDRLRITSHPGKPE